MPTRHYIYTLLILCGLGNYFYTTKTSKTVIKNSTRIYGYSFKDNSGNVVDVIYGTNGKGKTLHTVPMLVYYRKNKPHPQLLFINDSFNTVVFGNIHYTVPGSPIIFFEDKHSLPFLLSDSWKLKFIMPVHQKDLEKRIKELLQLPIHKLKRLKRGKVVKQEHPCRRKVRDD